MQAARALASTGASRSPSSLAVATTGKESILSMLADCSSDGEAGVGALGGGVCVAICNPFEERREREGTFVDDMVHQRVAQTGGCLVMTRCV